MAITDKLTAIANAIRAKTGKTESLTLEQMPTEIESITTGGGSSDDVRYVTFRNEATGEEFVKPVATGDDCVDVVAKGLWAKPTKPSDAQYDYTFYGWGASDGGAADSTILQNITEDKTVYAIYTKTLRYYTITYYDEDGTTVLKTESLAYGATPSYTPSSREGYLFTGWTPAVTIVTQDESYTAIWEESSALIQGTFASGVNWVLKTDGVMTISGTGAMDTYSLTARPWHDHIGTIKKLIVEEGVTTIGGYAFNGASNLSDVSLPSTLTLISDMAFKGSGITTISIPGSVTNINDAFENCPNLTQVTIGEGVTKILGYAFMGCTALKSILLPDSLTELQSNVFQNCSALTSITIPSGVTLIRKEVFKGTGLTNATFKNTSGWYVTKTYGATSGTNVTVTNSSTAATYLKSTYLSYFWYRSQ